MEHKRDRVILFWQQLFFCLLVNAAIDKIWIGKENINNLFFLNHRKKNIWVTIFPVKYPATKKNHLIFETEAEIKVEFVL